MRRRGKSRYKPPTRTTSYYSLSEIRSIIESGRVNINGDAALDAITDFGWKTDDVLRAIQRLRPQDFIKTDPSLAVPGRFLDFYRASMEGMRFYTHFYVDTRGWLIVNSFHRP